MQNCKIKHFPKLKVSFFSEKNVLKISKFDLILILDVLLFHYGTHINDKIHHRFVEIAQDFNYEPKVFNCTLIVISNLLDQCST